MDEIDETELIDALKNGTAAGGMKGGAKRGVKAALLRKCCRELKDQVDPRGMRLRGVVVLGCLDLAGLTVPFPLGFDACGFDSAPVEEGATLAGLSLSGPAGHSRQRAACAP